MSNTTPILTKDQQKSLQIEFITPSELSFKPRFGEIQFHNYHDGCIGFEIDGHYRVLSKEQIDVLIQWINAEKPQP